MKRFLRGKALGFNTPRFCRGMHERTQVRDARSAWPGAPQSLLRGVASLAVMPLVFMLMLAACAGGGDVLTGTWVDDQENIYQFGNNGTLTIGRNDPENQAASEGKSCLYALTPDNEDEKSLTGKIKITIHPQEGKEIVSSGTYALEEDNSKLTITGDDGSKSVLSKAQ